MSKVPELYELLVQDNFWRKTQFHHASMCLSSESMGLRKIVFLIDTYSSWRVSVETKRNIN